MLPKMLHWNSIKNTQFLLDYVNVSDVGKVYSLTKRIYDRNLS